jgi:hypothetical protein
MPAAGSDRHAAKGWNRGDPTVKDGTEGGKIGAAIAADEASRPEQAGDEEYVYLAETVEHQVRLVDRREPPCRRPHAARLCAPGGHRRRWRSLPTPSSFLWVLPWHMVTISEHRLEGFNATLDEL